MNPSARVLADSICDGHRVTTMEVTFHRNVLAEFNTHRVFSRNSASSRAIPIEKMLARAAEHPAFPLAWSRDQPGMQGGMELEGADLFEAQELLSNVATYTVQAIDAYLKSHPDRSTRLHKSYVNRMLEWFSWHTVIVTSVEWENFFLQRRHWKAQKEIRAVAELMAEAYDTSEPEEKAMGDWHTPLILPDEADLPVRQKLALSAARCARVSYLTHDGRRDRSEDFRLFYDTLLDGIDDPDDPPHWSPLEHVCTPLTKPKVYFKAGEEWLHDERIHRAIPGNLGTAVGSIWAQLRHYDPLGVCDKDADPRKMDS